LYDFPAIADRLQGDEDVAPVLERPDVPAAQRHGDEVALVDPLSAGECKADDAALELT
jgi:hypothetical protein